MRGVLRAARVDNNTYILPDVIRLDPMFLQVLYDTMYAHAAVVSLRPMRELEKIFSKARNQSGATSVVAQDCRTTVQFSDYDGGNSFTRDDHYGPMQLLISAHRDAEPVRDDAKIAELDVELKNQKAELADVEALFARADERVRELDNNVEEVERERQGLRLTRLRQSVEQRRSELEQCRRDQRNLEGNVIEVKLRGIEEALPSAVRSRSARRTCAFSSTWPSRSSKRSWRSVTSSIRRTRRCAARFARCRRGSWPLRRR
jgi:chromosome segregation ATPase